VNRKEFTDYLLEEGCTSCNYDEEKNHDSGELWVNHIVGSDEVNVPNDENLSVWTCVLILRQLNVDPPSGMEDMYNAMSADADALLSKIDLELDEE